MTTRPYTKRFVELRPDLSDPSLVGAWQSRPIGGRMVDLTAGAHHGVPTGGNSTVRCILGYAQLFTGGSHIDCGSLATDINALSFWVRPTAANDYLFDIKAGTHFVYLTAGAIDPSGWTDPDVYVNGQAAATPVLNAWNHVLISTATPITADNFNWGVATANYFDGELCGVEVYNEEKGAAFAAAQYARGARAVQFATAWGVKDSVADEVAGMYAGFNSSPWRIEAGEVRMITEAIGTTPCKAIQSRAAEVNTRVAVPTTHFEGTPTEAAFGTWDWWAEKVDGDVMDVGIISSDAALTAGYYIRHAADNSLSLIEVGGATLMSGGTATSGVPHEHRVTRRFDGTFTCYCDGVSWGVPVADLTTTTSSYNVAQFGTDGGSKLYHGDMGGGHCYQKMLGEEAA